MLNVSLHWIVGPRSRGLQATFEFPFLDHYHLVCLDVLGVHARVHVAANVVWSVPACLSGVSAAICSLAKRNLALEVMDHLGIATWLRLRRSRICTTRIQVIDHADRGGSLLE